MTRLKDVAERAGVSLMTVSKVMRDAPDVSLVTKARIRGIAEEMGYVPDALARGLRTRKTKLFGLVIPSANHPLLSQVAEAIQNRAHELGYDLLLAQTQDSPRREELCLRRLLSRRIDGLFVYPVYRLAPVAPIYEELLKSRTPTVLLGHRAPFCNSYAAIETDDAQASFQLTQHLIQLGHRQIAFFAGPPAAPWAQERLEGYRRGLREAQIAFEDRLIFTAGSTLEDGQQAALQMLSETPGATAVQAVSDTVAMGVAGVLWSQGLRIPENLSLAGFGNHLSGEHLRISLTTVDQPRSGIGMAAVECMLQLLRGETPPLQRLSAQLIIRQSTAPPGRETGLLRPSPSRPPDASLMGEDDLQ